MNKDQRQTTKHHIDGNGEIVFILGAGASRHAGLPLLSDFFQHADSVRVKNQHGQYAPNDYPDALDRVHSFRRFLRKEKPQVDIHNVSQVWSRPRDPA